MLNRTKTANADWKSKGIKVVKSASRSCDTPDTKGMNRQVAISGTRTGSASLWAGTNHIKPGEATGAHHHGELESVIFIISGHAIMRLGERTVSEYITKAGPGDFLLVPSVLPHQELNAADVEDLHCGLVRSCPEEVIVNLELDAVDVPEWIEF